MGMLFLCKEEVFYNSLSIKYGQDGQGGNDEMVVVHVKEEMIHNDWEGIISF